MSKQDRQGVRTPADLERKYNLGNLGKSFAEVLDVSLDTRISVDAIKSELRSEFEQQITSLTRDTERIILAALESYAESGEVEDLRRTVQSELTVMADKITMDFTTTTEKIVETNGELLAMAEKFYKHFDFSEDGLGIRAGENAMHLELDNDLIIFKKNGEQFGWWDGVDFHTGNIVVSLNERAQFGIFAFVPRSDGSLDFLKVGG